MKVIIIDKVVRLVKARKKLESELNIKITNKGKEFSINGTPEDEYIAEKVIEAMDIGFPLSTALLIKEEDFMFEVLPIKDFTKRHDLDRIRARIIGTKGKTLAALEQLTKCFFQVKDNEVGIIGDPEHIQTAQESIKMIIQGSKQANVYAYLEKHQPAPIIDLGLKEKELNL